MISSFAPRHGRILQGKFDTSGTLVIRAPQIFDFLHKNERAFDLFVRYLNSEPQGGDDFEYSHVGY